MKKRLLISTAIVASLIALNACCTVVPGKVIYSDSLQGTIEDVHAKAALLVTDDGKILVYNEKGDRSNIRECKIPEPAKKPLSKRDMAKKDQMDYPADVCKGLRKGSAITNIQTLSILKSNSQDCIAIGKDQEGNLIEVCWPTP